MNRRYGSVLVALVTAALLLMGMGAVLAQGLIEPSEPGASQPDPIVPVGQPDGDGGAANVLAVSGALAASDSDTPLPAAGLSEQNGPPADSSLSVAQSTLAYVFAAGATFRGKNSTTAVTYNTRGCVSAGDQINTELHLPDGAVIKYVRMYYIDSDAANNITAWLTKYAPGVASVDITSLQSTGNAGYSTTQSVEFTETVDNATYAYSLIGAPPTNSSILQFCGIRVAYYAPPLGFALFLPAIRNQP